MPKRPYDTRLWKDKLRPAILERDRHQCQIRYPGCTIQATAVDHIVSWEQGGSWYEPLNLRAACRNCNTAKRDRPPERMSNPAANW